MQKMADVTYMDKDGNIITEYIYIPNGAMRFLHIDYDDKRYAIDANDVPQPFDESWMKYPYSEEPIKITSKTKTEEILLDIMDINGNRFRDIIKVGIEPTIIKLEDAKGE